MNRILHPVSDPGCGSRRRYLETLVTHLGITNQHPLDTPQEESDVRRFRQVRPASDPECLAVKVER